MKLNCARIVVSGGAGFIGSHLVDRLLTMGNTVVVIDDFSSGNSDSLAHHGSNPRLEIRKADILNQTDMVELCLGADVVFHLACRSVRLSLRHPTIVHEVNATGTLNMLKAAVAARVKRFLYCSSSEVNGTAEMIPMPEDYHFKPETIYGASKLVGEYYTSVFFRSGWLDTVVVRPHNNYGPRAHYRGILGEVIPRFIIRGLAGLPLTIYGTGEQTRDFTYVKETSYFLVRIAELDQASGMTLNLCRGQEVSIGRIADLISDLTGQGASPEFLPKRPSDVMRLVGDATRLRLLVGSVPAVSIEEGLRRTVAWYRENVPITPQLLESMEPRSWETIEPEAWLARLVENREKGQ